ARPFGRRIATGLIGQNIAVPVGVLAGDDDAGLVGVLAGRRGGIDRHDDPHQVRDISMDWPARLLDQRAGPKGTGYVVQYLGVELLAAEPGALVLADDLLQKRRREVGPIVVCRAARDHCGEVGDQLADDLDRLGGGCDNRARIIAETQPEHQHVPRLWIPPGGYFITPRGVVLRPPQALRLVGAVGCRNGPVRPISYAAEDAVIRRVAAAFVEPLRSALEVRNQARVHV